MEFQTAKPHSKKRYVHTNHQSLRKCCGCIHLRIGGVFSCLIWAGFSLYFAVISFQSQSPFYSYMTQAPLLVFGVCNLALFLISLGGLFTLFLNLAHAVQVFSHSLWVAVFIVIIDAFINMILFGTLRSEYQSWCSDAGNSKIPSSVNFHATQDVFNCDRLWQDEFKFSLVSVFLMVTIYLYWATCIYSYSHKLAAVEMWERGMLTGQVEGIAPFFRGLPAPMAPPDQPNVIVLQNEKPSRHKKNGDLLSSLRPWKKSTKMKSHIAPVESSSSPHPSESIITTPSPTQLPTSYPLNFKLGVNGNVIELK
ncbi:uncharacterized protein BX664DRAFT_320187 [Halteromyces radiatus]|uniref:uncharacterized protein n=1 Tax=Halteromyces radiatus TaxID=101107 RepID=UPI0022201AE2|nr:uncharacterized protein BX664DRAFT_320187 [Halteromyces radiatus]KAI8099019.1 hypothetical protein BX664DRAFT_320187 [Halteromyces radiatus]